MIISHRHKFIFLKTKKTAGTSIEIALSRYCGPDDIITPIAPDDEAMRRQLGYPGPQHCWIPWDSAAISPEVKRTTAIKQHKTIQIGPHAPAQFIKEQFGTRVWDSYYKFCFERNPWDRVISLYYWRNKSEPRPSLADFVASEEPLRLKHGGYNLYTIDGQVAVDRVCRFENIPAEMEALAQRMGFNGDIELPRAKSGFRPDNRHYRGLLGEKEKARIATLFREEIDLLGYEF